MTELEQKAKAKIPCPETGIEVKRTLCDICSPGPQCGISAYVKDGRVIKVEGLEGYPGSNGRLCTKGAANRQYIYHEDRLKTPLRRTGPRGSGSFEPISWETAYEAIGSALNGIKAEYGADAVAWYTGYCKWYRPWLKRLVFDWGSLNYGTESSACHMSTELAWKTTAGLAFSPDLAHTKVFLAWGCNPYYSAFLKANRLLKMKERGVKIILIDPRETPTADKVADLHLKLRPGTDGALALGMGKLILDNSWQDQAFIDQYVYGFEAYKTLTDQYPLDKVARITGLNPGDIYEAARLYATQGPSTINESAAAITHRTNGFNNYRAMIALQAITGNIDRRGGALPIHETYLQTACGFDTREEEFAHFHTPNHPREKIGAARFPVFAHQCDEFQAMDLVRHINTADPYPLKALMAFGMNRQMFPDHDALLRAFDKLDFVAATDLFMTDVCRHADIVLPACSSFERGELKAYPGGFLTATQPVIQPLYDSKPDTVILCELSRYLDLEVEDPLLRDGYDACQRFLISHLPVTLEQLRAGPLPVKVATRPYQPGALLDRGFPTQTGKLELCSTLIQSLGRADLNPLPAYSDSLDGPETPERPYTLVIGPRLPNAIHSRLHRVSWTRSLRPNPSADLHPALAEQLGIRDGDPIELFTANGAVQVTAHLVRTGREEDIYFYHGYQEADGNRLLPPDHLDPYSGFPGYRQLRCGIRMREEAR